MLELLYILFLSALPITELRGSIPLGILTYNLEWWQVSPIAILGNLIPIPLVFILLLKLKALFCHSRRLNLIIGWLYNLGNKRGKNSLIARYGVYGLILFVAVPLPATGAWTASLIAVALGFNLRKSFLCIVIGLILASIIVTALTINLNNAFSP